MSKTNMKLKLEDLMRFETLNKEFSHLANVRYALSHIENVHRYILQGKRNKNVKGKEEYGI